MDRDYTAPAAPNPKTEQQTAKASAEAVSAVEREAPAKSAKSAQSPAKGKAKRAPARKERSTPGATDTDSKQDSTDKPLTGRQALFCREYIIDLNSTQAAIRAGYSEKAAAVIGHENLRKPNIQAEIQRLQSGRAEKLEITADRVLQELAKIGFADIRDIVSWEKTGVDEDGKPAHSLSLIGSDEITDNTAAAIREISEGPTGLKIKMHDKQAALLNIGRHLGMFKDKVEHSGGIAVDSTVRFVDPPVRDD